MNGMEIKKDTFVKLDEKGRSEILFDYLDYMIKKLDNMERKESRVQTEAIAVGGVFGFLGGMIAIMGKWIIGQ